MSLNVFDLQEVDYRYEAKRDVPYQPALTGINPITFSIPPSEGLTDLSKSQLVVKLQLNHPHVGYTGIANDRASSTATATKTVVVINNFAHSIFKSMVLKMNGAWMTKQMQHYHHKAYIETLLNRSRDEGETMLVPQGWVNQVNVVSKLANAEANQDHPTAEEQTEATGFTVLKTLTERVAGTHWCTFIIKPHLAPFHSENCLVPGLQLELELYLNLNTIYLFGYPQKGNMAAGLKEYPQITS